MSTVSPKMLKRAIKLGVQGAATMDFWDLSRAMRAAPATTEQVKFIESLMAYLKREIPASLTYEQASSILDDVAPLVNQQVLQNEGWTVGAILQWKDGYFRITKISRDHRFCLRRVEYTPATGKSEAFVEDTRTKAALHNPFTLSGEAITISLSPTP